MTYTKKTWSSGDLIDAISLNNIENGIKANSNAIKTLQNNVPTETLKVIDLVMFMGQSNMAGRGTASESPVVSSGHGYEFRAMSDPTKLYDIVEPFGKNENNSASGVTENSKTGSMVSSFVSEYYKLTNTPIVAVSCSKGGTSIDFWQPSTGALNDAINRHNLAKEWLLQNGYTVRRDFMVWCQGETDGDKSMSKDIYTSKIKSMIEGMKTCGVEKCFIVRIGNHKTNSTLYDPIIAAQTELCKTYEDAVLVSTDFAGMADAGLMKDSFHYTQKGYNIAGANAGKHTAYYINNGVEPCMYDVEYNNMYIPYNVELGGGSSITLDTSLSTSSTNGVQNKVVASAINNITNQVQSILGEITSLTLEVSETKTGLVDLESRIINLESGGSVELFPITYDLTLTSSSNTVVKIIKGKSYSTVLTPDLDCEIISVSVRMGGVDITETCLFGTAISIPEVTGNIEITAVSKEVSVDGEYMLNLDFTKKSLADYASSGVLSLSTEDITSVHTSEGDLFKMPENSFVSLKESITFPTNFEIRLRLKTTDNSHLVTNGGLPLFNNNNGRPMLNLRYGGSGVPGGGLFLQSRLLSSGGDPASVHDLGIPVRDNLFHDVIIHYEGENLWMSVDGVKSATTTVVRASNTVNYMFGLPSGGTNYRWDNVTLSYLRVIAL